MCTETVSSEIRWDEAPFYSNDVPIFVFIVVVVVVVVGGGGGGGAAAAVVVVVVSSVRSFSSYILLVGSGGGRGKGLLSRTYKSDGVVDDTYVQFSLAL